MKLSLFPVRRELAAMVLPSPPQVYTTQHYLIMCRL